MEISSEWAQMLDFAGKVFKAAIVHMFKELKKKYRLKKLLKERKSRAEKYNTERFTGLAQPRTRYGRKKAFVNLRQINGSEGTFLRSTEEKRLKKNKQSLRDLWLLPDT